MRTTTLVATASCPLLAGCLSCWEVARVRMAGWGRSLKPPPSARVMVYGGGFIWLGKPVCSTSTTPRAPPCHGRARTLAERRTAALLV